MCDIINPFLEKGEADEKFIEFEQLRSNDPDLVELNWSGLGDIGAAKLGEVLKFNKVLTIIDLNHNKIGDIGAAALGEGLKSNEALTVINLRSNNIGDVGAAALGEGLKSNKTLTTIDLIGNNIGHVGATALGEVLKINDALTTIRLIVNDIGDVGAKALGEGLECNEALNAIFLSSTKIGEVGAVALGEGLKSNKSLTIITLDRNNIRDVGATELGEVLKFNETLTVIDLGCNNIGDVGATALGAGLKSNKALTKINLSRNDIGDVGATALGEGLRINEVLIDINLRNNNIGDVGTKELGEAFKSNKALTTINLSFNKIGEDGATALGEMLKSNKALTKLDLNTNKIGEDGAVALGEALKSNKALTTIDLGRNNIGDVGATALGGVLKSNEGLTTIDLKRNDIGDVGATALGKGLKSNEALTIIDLGRNNIGDAGVTALGEGLRSNEALTTIDLRRNDIGDLGAAALGGFLKSNKALTTINLSSNNIGDLGATALGEGLRSNETLTSIDVFNCRVSSNMQAPINMIAGNNKRLKEHFTDIQKMEGNNKLPYYIKEHEVPSSTPQNDNAHLKWTPKAWEAATTGDGRILRILLEVLQMYEGEMSKNSVKLLLTEDVGNEGDLFLHRSAQNDHPIVLELLKWFVEDKKFVDMDLEDQNGRVLREIAIGNKNHDIMRWAKSYGTFLNRYRIDGNKGLDGDPVHESDTCTVFFATDMGKGPIDERYCVALKLMKDQENFDRELKARLNINPDTVPMNEDIPDEWNTYEKDHVVPLYRYHRHCEVSNSKVYHCLVLAKGAKSLHQIIDSERIAGQDIDKIRFYGADIARAILHMHQNGCIHGDVKPRNMVRTSDGDMKLIDLDSTVKIKDDLTGKKMSTAYISPEVAKVQFRPKETMEALEEKLEQLEKKRDEMIERKKFGAEFTKVCLEFDALKEKIGQLLNRTGAMSKEILQANKSMDIWGFGVTMYQLCSVKVALFRYNPNDDTLINENEQSRLLNWEGPTQDDLNKILPDCENQDMKRYADEFFKICLHKEKNKRFQDMNAIIAHPFFVLYDKGYSMLSSVDKESDNSPLIDRSKDFVGAVVMVGLWNTENSSLVNVGSGFIVDNSRGLILTAGHIFCDILGEKIGPLYRGHRNAKAIIGTMQKTKDGDDSDTVHFTYFAEIITNRKNMTKADAVVLKITSKVEEPFQVPQMQKSITQDNCIHSPIMHDTAVKTFKNEKMKKMDLSSTSNLGDKVKIIGFNQSGEERHRPGVYINYKASIAKGYVCATGHSGHTSVPTGVLPWVSATQSEIIVENCPAYEGHSGGPCVNQDGEVIGIMCREHNRNEKRCYLVPASALKEIFEKAKRLIW